MEFDVVRIRPFRPQPQPRPLSHHHHHHLENPSDYRRGVLQPRVVPFQVSVEEAKREFERWHASTSWLSPTGLLKGAVAGPGLPPDSATAAATAAASKAAAKAAKASAAANASESSLSEAEASTSLSSTTVNAPSLLPPTVNAVLLPFWLFETAVHVDFRAKVLVSEEEDSSGSSSSTTSRAADYNASASTAPTGWTDTGWRSRGYREYPWTLAACQVCAAYGVRRDLARAAAVPGVLGRSRPLRQWEAAAGRAVDVGCAGRCGASGRRSGGGGGLRNKSPSSTPSSDPNSPDFSYSFSAFSAAATATGDSGAPLSPRDMRQSVAWALALRSIRKSEADSARRLLEREVKARNSSSSSSDNSSSSHHHNHTPTSESSFSGSSASSETVRDVRVRLRPLKRRARVVYLPAYVLTYALGERIGPEGGRYPATFQALVSGLDAGSVAGERHLSPLKVQAVAGVGAAGLALLGGLWSKGGAAGAAGAGGIGTAASSPASAVTSFLDPVSLAFWSFLAVAAGGVAARAATHLMREAEEAERLRSEEEAFERAAAAGLGPTAADFASSSSSKSSFAFSNEDLAAAAAEREAGEWRRWEEADRWSWDAGARAAWAEGLVREQARRRLDARRLREQAAAAAAKAAADAAAEGRRRERFGGGGGGGSTENDGGGGFSWANSSSSWPAGRDHLGYYRALGLSPADAPTPEAVKLAFRSAAFRLHPDRVASQRRREGEEEERQRNLHQSLHSSSSSSPQHHHHQHHHLGDAPGRARAAARFARVRAAYEVLRDPERRADYDRGGSGSESREGESGGGGRRQQHQRRWY